MTLHLSVRERLHAIEALLRETQYWQENAPQSSAFASDSPFCMDTMEPLEWLQWVLIPRMHQLLDAEQPLPQSFAVAPIMRWPLMPLTRCAIACWRSCCCWIPFLRATTPDAGDYLSGRVAGGGQ